MCAIGSLLSEQYVPNPSSFVQPLVIGSTIFQNSTGSLDIHPTELGMVSNYLGHFCRKRISVQLFLFLLHIFCKRCTPSPLCGNFFICWKGLIETLPDEVFNLMYQIESPKSFPNHPLLSSVLCPPYSDFLDLWVFAISFKRE